MEPPSWRAPKPSVASVDVNAVTSFVRQEFSKQFAQDGAQGGESVADGSPDTALAVRTAPDAQDLLTEQITSARTGEEVLSVFSWSPQNHTSGHVSAVCRRLAMRMPTFDARLSQTGDFMSFLREAKLVIKEEPPDAQSMASLIWSIGLLRYPLPDLQDLLPILAEDFWEVSQSMNPQNATSCLSALAKLQRDNPVILELAGPLIRIVADGADVEEMSSQQISAIIWAVGELQLEDNSEVYELTNTVLGGLPLERLEEFSSKDLTNLVWGLAQLGERDLELLAEVRRIVVRTAGAMDKKAATFDLPMLICGMVRLQSVNDELLEAVAPRLLKKGTMKRMNNWGLCALLWSWPRRDVKGNQMRVYSLLEDQRTKRGVTSAQVECSWVGPMEWLMDSPA